MYDFVPYLRERIESSSSRSATPAPTRLIVPPAEYDGVAVPSESSSGSGGPGPADTKGGAPPEGSGQQENKADQPGLAPAGEQQIVDPEAAEGGGGGSNGDVGVPPPPEVAFSSRG